MTRRRKKFRDTLIDRFGSKKSVLSGFELTSLLGVFGFSKVYPYSGAINKLKHMINKMKTSNS